jgi:hypothetical protein
LSGGVPGRPCGAAVAPATPARRGLDPNLRRRHSAAGVRSRARANQRPGGSGVIPVHPRFPSCQLLKADSAPFQSDRQGAAGSNQPPRSHRTASGRLRPAFRRRPAGSRSIIECTSPVGLPLFIALDPYTGRLNPTRSKRARATKIPGNSRLDPGRARHRPLVSKTRGYRWRSRFKRRARRNAKCGWRRAGPLGTRRRGARG